MSWTSVFPVMTAEMVKEFRACVSKEERAEFEQWFGIQRRINQRSSRILVSVSLFWKRLRATEQPLPPLSREVIMNAPALGLVRRHNPWEHYIEPVIRQTRLLANSHPHATVRVYLAADLEFLVDDLVAAGCEIFLMKSDSLCHNPGAMWRFLALSEKDRLVVVSDSDRLSYISTDILRTEEVTRSGHKFWRTPVCVDFQENRLQYRPIMATQFGSTAAIPTIRPLMEALIWNTRRGSISRTTIGGSCGPMTIVGTDWPDYGFDEWFLQTALYPRLSGRPILTLVEAGSQSRYLPLDIEYVTWANPVSEMAIFGNEKGCCPPLASQNPSASKRRRRSVDSAILLTGIWQVKTNNDAVLISELFDYARNQDLPVEVKPVLHLKDENVWNRLPSDLRRKAIVWENLSYNVSVQDNLMSAITFGHAADWIWEADSDERVDFKAVGGLKRIVHLADKVGADYVPGHWIDRIHPDGTLPKLEEGIGLHSLFPAAVLATKYFQKSLDLKVALHRRDCPTSVGNHRPRDPRKIAGPSSVPIWHFKWHSDCPENQAAKIEADKGAGWIFEFRQALAKMTSGADGARIDWTSLPPEAWLVVRPEHKRGHYPVGYLPMIRSAIKKGEKELLFSNRSGAPANA